MNIQTNNIFIITGTSGGGKDSVANLILESHSEISKVVTHTSRPPRDNEIPGKDYHFVSENEFKTMINNDEFIEWANVYGQYKGISKKEILSVTKQQNDILLRINIDGVISIKSLYPKAIAIFISAPNVNDLTTRLNLRNSDSEVDKQARISEIGREHSLIEKCDYFVPNYDGKLDETVKIVDSIITSSRYRISAAKST
jgi:guanylate kinase